ncbi:unnamed protein product, partial [Meganyctiphanes norvegica]
IRVETVTSMYSFNCDPRQHHTQSEPEPEPEQEPEQEPESANRPVPKPVLKSLPRPSLQPALQPAPRPTNLPPSQPYVPPSSNTGGNMTFSLSSEEDKGNLGNTSFHIRGWMLSIVAAIILVLTLLVIQIRRQFKNRNRDPALIQPKDDESRLSQEVNENSV